MTKNAQSGALRFKVEYIKDKGSVLVIARQLQKKNFSIGDHSTLGGCRLAKHLDMPRAILEDGRQDPDVFVFSLADENDRQKLSVGDTVEFVP